MRSIRTFEFVTELPAGYRDGQARLLVVRMLEGEHEQLLVTHPHQQPLLVDMEAKTIRNLLP